MRVQKKKVIDWLKKNKAKVLLAITSGIIAPTVVFLLVKYIDGNKKLTETELKAIQASLEKTKVFESINTREVIPQIPALYLPKNNIEADKFLENTNALPHITDKELKRLEQIQSRRQKPLLYISTKSLAPLKIDGDEELAKKIAITQLDKEARSPKIKQAKNDMISRKIRKASPVKEIKIQTQEEKDLQLYKLSETIRITDDERKRLRSGNQKPFVSGLSRSKTEAILKTIPVSKKSSSNVIPYAEYLQKVKTIKNLNKKYNSILENIKKTEKENNPEKLIQLKTDLKKYKDYIYDMLNTSERIEMRTSNIIVPLRNELAISISLASLTKNT